MVHLGAVSIGDSRWSDAQKKRILRSRIDGTTLLATTIAAATRPPGALLSASAVGYYGDSGDVVIDESSAPGDDFAARVCVEWEAATAAAVDAGIRTVCMRSGVVLAAEGGALAKQLPFFKVGLGGRSGSGRQYLSWISIDDEVAAITWLLTSGLSGAVNLTAPEPVTNAEFARTLGRVLHRPTTVIPMFGPRLLYGRELADSLLLTSLRAVPARLLADGFTFGHGTLEPALRHILRP